MMIFKFQKVSIETIACPQNLTATGRPVSPRRAVGKADITSIKATVTTGDLLSIISTFAFLIACIRSITNPTHHVDQSAEKFSKMRSPTRCDFSGWNCVAITLSRQMLDAKSIP